jgi:cob(I)alamin adenosyltransferase
LATDKEGTKMKLPSLIPSDIEALENWIDKMDETLEPMKSFVLPGGHTTVSYCHIARCVCRRGERIIVDLSNNETVDPIIMKYANRLSDYLFVLSRKLTSDLDAPEAPWKPRL